MKFINRDSELKALNQKWLEKKPQLFIIYGKRRIGKTELIKQFAKEKAALYFLADKRTVGEQLAELGRIIGRFFDDAILEKRGFSDWLEAFQYLKGKAKGRLVMVIDEYPYLTETNNATSSIFQKGWDEYLKDSPIFMILSGSSISMMESEALIYKSPLYGRRTGQMLLKPLSFHESRKFFPKKSFEEFLKIFAITGGVPAYLIQIDPALSIKENVKQKIFAKTEFLHNEVEFVLKEELREPKNYLSILKAISFGKRKFGEISNETDLQKNTLTKYLNTLERLQIIEKELSVTEKAPQKSRKGLYKISDNFFRFWFQYVFPYKSDLEIERFDEVIGKFEESFISLEALAYEEVSREITWRLRDLIFPFEKIGKWWEKEKEIDVVGINNQTKQIVFGECKWSNKPVGTNIYEDLKKKAGYVQWQKDKRKEYYILFSKSGFTADMIKLAKKEKVFLVEKDKTVER